MVDGQLEQGHIGQQNQKRALFKGLVQDGNIIFMPNEYIT